MHDFLEQCEVGTIFALPWMITWFGHVLPDYEDVVRLYDFFLSKVSIRGMYTLQCCRKCRRRLSLKNQLHFRVKSFGENVI